MNPSRLWTRLLGRSLPAEDRDSIVAELAELYRARAELSGRSAADAWYRREVLSFVVGVPLDRFRSRIPRKETSMTEQLFDLGRELRQAARSLIAQPGVTVTCVLALVLGIGANTLIFSVVDHVVLRALPYGEPERLVDIWPEASLLRGELGFFEERATTVEGLGGYLRTDGFNAEFPDGSQRLSGNMISPELLEVLGVRAAVGRNFLPREDQPGNDAVVMLSHGFWRSRYGADDGAIGSTLTLDGTPREIVGVLPAGFSFPGRGQDVVVPFVMDPSDAGPYWGYGGYYAVARMRRGVTTEQVREELQALSLETRLLNPLWTPAEDFRANTTVVPLRDSLVGGVQSNLLVLLGAVGLVLVVACANVANLLLARGLARGHELAVRAAIGAGRRRLLRQQLTESLLLVVVGCAAAMFVAWNALEMMVSMLPAEIPRTDEIRLDGRVLGISVAVALLAGLVASLIPALRAARVDPGAAMREGGRAAGSSARRRRLSAAMVVVQVTAAVVLVTGAGLLIRTLGALGSVDPGFDAAAITTARITLTPEQYDSAESRIQLYESLIERLRARPGVTAAAASHVPFGEGTGYMATFIEDATPDPNSLPVLSRVLVTPGYFRTMGIPLVQGRAIAASDNADSKLIAVVDRTMADRFWRGESPIGKRIRYPWRGAPWIEVVGVVGGTAGNDLAAARDATFYVPLHQEAPLAVNVVARRADGEPVPAAAIRQIVAELDPRTPVSNAGALHLMVADSLARARWSALLLSLFAALTLALGCIGVYGVVAYSVGERTREIGVQMALGAAPRQIRARVLLQGLMLALPGAAIGLLVAVPAARGLESLLFGVPAIDPVTFVTVPVLLVIATLLAVYVPARRATRVDPSEALRAEV